jgi:hypothetical protein
MKPLATFSIKSGLAALGLVAGLALPAMAGTMPQPMPITPDNSLTTQITPVRDDSYGNWRWRRNNQQMRYHYRNRGDYYRRDWNRRNWNHRRNFRHYNGSGFYFGLGGLGMGLGAPVYREYIAPRRVYRYGPSSSAHVQWCYSRYRSYRAYDNTFQPYNGPRRPCYSPY